MQSPLLAGFLRWILVLLLAWPARGFGLGPDSLFAPRYAGDGQNAGWRIINTLESGKAPWTAIGNFMIPGLGRYCSAVLIAPRVVLTANHCLYATDFNRRDALGNPQSQLMDATRFVFFAGVHDTEFADMVEVEQVIAGGWTPASPDSSRDWVIAILRRPVGPGIVPIPPRPYVARDVRAAWSGRIVVAGYPGTSVGNSAVLRLSFLCSLRNSAVAAIIQTDCMTEGGSSGGPILVEENGRFGVIGISVSARANGSRDSRGVSINTFLAAISAAFARYAQASAVLLADDAVSHSTDVLPVGGRTFRNASSDIVPAAPPQEGMAPRALP